MARFMGISRNVLLPEDMDNFMLSVDSALRKYENSKKEVMNLSSGANDIKKACHTSDSLL